MRQNVPGKLPYPRGPDLRSTYLDNFTPSAPCSEVVPYLPLEVYSTVQINWDTDDSRRYFSVVLPTQCLIMLTKNVKRQYIIFRQL